MQHPRKDYNERIQDAAGLIPDNEPVVLLRGQDQLATQALDFYAYLCEQNQAPEVAAKIRVHIERMKAWPKKKIPDVPQGV